MKKLLTVDEVRNRLESFCGQKIWNYAVIGQAGVIENTPYHMLTIMVTRSEKDVIWITDKLSDVLNIEEIRYTGVPQAQAQS